MARRQRCQGPCGELFAPADLVTMNGTRLCPDCQAQTSVAEPPPDGPPPDTGLADAIAATAAPSPDQLKAEQDTAYARLHEGRDATPADESPDVPAIPVPSFTLPLPDKDYTRYPRVDDVPGWPLPKGNISASALKSLATCPERFRHSYIDGHWGPSWGSGIAGTAMHSAVEAAERWYLEHRAYPSPEAILDAYDRAWPVALADQRGAIVWKGSPESMQAKGRVATEAYVEDVLPRLVPIEVERRFDVWVSGSPVPLVGKIDCVAQVEGFNGLQVIDRKTGGQISNDVKSEWLIQGYAYLLARQLPVQWHTVSHAGKVTTPWANESDRAGDALRLPLDSRTYTLASQVLSNLIKSLLMYAREFGTAGPWPGALTHTYACTGCDHRADCPWWEPQQGTVGI